MLGKFPTHVLGWRPCNLWTDWIQSPSYNPRLVLPGGSEWPCTEEAQDSSYSRCPQGQPGHPASRWPQWQRKRKPLKLTVPSGFLSHQIKPRSAGSDSPELFASTWSTAFQAPLRLLERGWRPPRLDTCYERLKADSPLLYPRSWIGPCQVYILSRQSLREKGWVEAMCPTLCLK